jgi:hypothetical protein
MAAFPVGIEIPLRSTENSHPLQIPHIQQGKAYLTSTHTGKHFLKDAYREYSIESETIAWEPTMAAHRQRKIQHDVPRNPFFV